MPAATLVTERPVGDTSPEPDPAPAPHPARRVPTLARLLPLAAMAAGVALIGSAIALVVARDARPGAPTGDPATISVSARDISVVSQVYAPGEDSGWHAHPGIHAVSVLSGVLTVYDARCQRQTFEAGRPYVGGQHSHLVRNEGTEPVVMAVTYVQPSAQSGITERTAPPAGCTAA